jgi:Uma2 family endonuclease
VSKARTRRWMSPDLQQFPDDGQRYAIIGGDLLGSKQPDWYHQLICSRLLASFDRWDEEGIAGVANVVPGLIFAQDDDAAPDLVWISATRLPTVLAEDGKLHAAPDLVVEGLSPGITSIRRDHEAKRALYGRRGVREYWIVDWRAHRLERHGQRESGEPELRRLDLRGEADDLTSPLLPGYHYPLRRLFAGIPRG